MEQISQDKLAAIGRKVQALLNLANSPNEAEAELAMEKAQELLLAYNLDMANLGQSDKKRSDQKIMGGLYKWQRTLWNQVARLNFCVYWGIPGTQKGEKFQHRILGSHINTQSTLQMAEYLQGAIERITQDWAKDKGYKSVFVREAIAYREGMAEKIAYRLQERRRKQEREAQEKTEQDRIRQERVDAENAVKANHPAHFRTHRALTILDIKSNEDDLNNDYIHGWEPGTTAAQRKADEAQYAAWQEEVRKKREAKEQWERDHPLEAQELRLQAEAIRKAELAAWEKEEAKRAKRRKGPKVRMSKADRVRAYSFYDGYRKGDDVSLDRQVSTEDRKRLT